MCDAASWGLRRCPLLTIIVLSAACGESNDLRIGHGSDRLSACLTSADCTAEDDCRCGLCTQSCTSDDDCRGAVCYPNQGRSCELLDVPDAPGLCLWRCLSDDDCVKGGEHLTCEDGVCQRDLQIDDFPSPADAGADADDDSASDAGSEADGDGVVNLDAGPLGDSDGAGDASNPFDADGITWISTCDELPAEPIVPLPDREIPFCAEPPSWGWSNVVGGESWGVFGDVLALPDGGAVYVASFSEELQADSDGERPLLASAGGRDVLVARYGSDGGLLWATRAGGSQDDRAGGLVEAGTHRIVVSGRLNGTGTFDPDPGDASPELTLGTPGEHSSFVAVLDAATGRWLQGATIGPNASISRGAMAGLPDGSFTLVASVGPDTVVRSSDGALIPFESRGNRSLLLARGDKTGRLVRLEAVAGISQSLYEAIVANDAGGSLIVAGLFKGSATFGSGDHEVVLEQSNPALGIFLASYSSGGSLQSAYQIGEGLGELFLHELSARPDGSLDLVGEFDDYVRFSQPETISEVEGNQNNQGFHARLTREGHVLEHRHFATPDNSHGTAATAAPGGATWIAGDYDEVLTFEDMGDAVLETGERFYPDTFLLAFNAAGRFACGFDLGATRWATDARIDSSPEGSLVVVTSFQETLTLDAWPGAGPVHATGGYDNFLGRLDIAEACHNGTDDDFDGLVDCADPDCPGRSDCFEVACYDGLDGDGDGNTDCLDADCAAAPCCGHDCVTADLGSLLGRGIITALASDAVDSVSSRACTGGGADHAYRWTAPRTGTYEVTVRGGAVGVLHLARGGCEGVEVACVSGPGPLRFAAASGQPFVIGVDGLSGGVQLSLDIIGTEASCADGADDDGDDLVDCDDSDCFDAPGCAVACLAADLGSALGEVATGDTLEGRAATAGSCGGAGNEIAYRWTAPEAGLYQFDTNGSTGDSVLYLRHGTCQGVEVACGDDLDDDTWTSSISAELPAGTAVVIFIDSYQASFDFVLNIKRE